MFTTTERLALAGFLAGYSGLAREACELDLRQFTGWRQQHRLCLFQAGRGDIEGSLATWKPAAVPAPWPGPAAAPWKRNCWILPRPLTSALPRIDDEWHATGLDRNELGARRNAVRQALLTLLARQAKPGAARELAAAVVRLDPPAEDRARAQEALLSLLARQVKPGMARELTEPVVWLAATAEDRARARQALLTLLARQAKPGAARELAAAVVRLGPPAEDRAQVRQARVVLLASRPTPRAAGGPADTIAELDPTVADLGDSDSWPFPPTAALLSAARKNSTLPDWLAALPLLSTQLSG